MNHSEVWGWNMQTALQKELTPLIEQVISLRLEVARLQANSNLTHRYYHQSLGGVQDSSNFDFTVPTNAIQATVVVFVNGIAQKFTWKDTQTITLGYPPLSEDEVWVDFSVPNHQ